MSIPLCALPDVSGQMSPLCRLSCLTDEEETLHKLAFDSINKRDFLKLMGLAEWVDCAPGEIIVEKGK